MSRDYGPTSWEILDPAVAPGSHSSHESAAVGETSAESTALPLKIVHVVLSLDVGGLERNVVNQVRQGRRLNQQNTVVCLDHPGLLARQVESVGGRVIAMHKPRGLCRILFNRLQALFSEIQPDVVHTHQLGSLLFGGRAARLSRVPLVIHTQHGIEDFIQGTQRRWLGRVAGRYCQRFYCLTQEMAQTMRANWIVPERKIRVICNGIDSEPFRRRCETASIRQSLGIPEGAPVIGTVGRLAEVKRQDVLIGAFARLRNKHPDAHLLLVGDGPLKEKLVKLAESLGISAQVHFAGYQSDTPRYYQIMNVFALSSRTEGLPQAAVEASFSGVPVVASRVGGLPELVDDGRTGLLFDAGDISGLAVALDRVLANPAWARTITQAAFARVNSRFEVSRMANEYHQHYLQFLGLPPARAQDVQVTH